jgi:PleD family two-component response regulator
VTVIVGSAEWADGDDLASLLAHADEALHHAKRDGRNRVFRPPAADWP